MHEVLDVYRPRIGVIDANPEIHKVQELKAKYSNIYSSIFHEGKIVISVNKQDRIVNMDRTALLDSVKANIDKELYINPLNAEFIDNGAYYSQMVASTRLLDIDEDHLDKSRFIWVHTAPDHYFLTEGYCLQALTLVPNIDSVIDFFKRNTTGLTPSVANIADLTPEQKTDIERRSRVSPEQALDFIRRKNNK